MWILSWRLLFSNTGSALTTQPATGKVVRSTISLLSVVHPPRFLISHSVPRPALGPQARWATEVKPKAIPTQHLTCLLSGQSHPHLPASRLPDGQNLEQSYLDLVSGLCTQSQHPGRKLWVQGVSPYHRAGDRLLSMPEATRISVTACTSDSASVGC